MLRTMLTNVSRREVQTAVVIGALVIAVLTAATLLTNDLLHRAQLAAAALFAVVFFFSPFVTLLALLFVRPLVDAYGNATFVLFDRIPFNLAALLGIAALVWGVAVFLRHRVRIWRAPLFWPMVLVLGSALPGFAFGVAPAATLREFMRLATVFLLALVAGTFVATPARLHTLHAVLAASLVLPAAVAFVQFFTHTGLTFGTFANRVYGTFGHPNVFAFSLAFLLAVLLPLVLRQGYPRPRWVWPAIILAATLLLLTYTRGAWIGVLITLGIVSAVRYRRLFFRTVVVLALLALLAPLAHRVFVDAFGVDLTRTQLVRRALDLERETDDSSIAFRLRLWREMSRKFSEQPLTGHGLGSFPVLRERQIQGFFQATEAHNDYLRLAIETGLLGLTAYLVLLAAVFRNLLAAYRAAASSDVRLAALCALAFLPAFLFMSFFDNLLQGTTVMWAFWAYLAAVISASRQPHRPRTEAATASSP